MTDNLFEAQYNVTKKTKIKKFYEENKILIYVFIFLTIIQRLYNCPIIRANIASI